MMILEQLLHEVSYEFSEPLFLNHSALCRDKMFKRQCLQQKLQKQKSVGKSYIHAHSRDCRICLFTKRSLLIEVSLGNLNLDGMQKT